MRLDEDSAKLLAWRREINAPFFQDLTPVEARAAMTAARVAANVAPPAVKEVRDHSIVAPGRAIAARRYAPDSTAAAGSSAISNLTTSSAVRSQMSMAAW